MVSLLGNNSNTVLLGVGELLRAERSQCGRCNSQRPYESTEEEVHEPEAEGRGCESDGRDATEVSKETVLYDGWEVKEKRP